MACTDSDLQAQINNCLAARGEAVMLAVIAQMLCRFNEFINGDAASFECDVDEMSTEVDCLAARGTADITSVIATNLCGVLTGLSTGLSNCGVGDPQNVVTGQFCGQKYWDTAGDVTYTFEGTPGTKVGWVI